MCMIHIVPLSVEASVTSTRPPGSRVPGPGCTQGGVYPGARAAADEHNMMVANKGKDSIGPLGPFDRPQIGAARGTFRPTPTGHATPN